MLRILFATTNPSKFEEAAAALKHDGWRILGLKDFPQAKVVPETGATFEENAILKAKGYFEQTRIPCIGDDGGLMVDYLGGAPGVNSHRWLGEEVTDSELAQGVIERLKSVPQEKRSAKLGGFVVFWDGEHLLKAENWIEGYIAPRVLGKVRSGFPYRPILMIPKFGKSYSELTHEEHEEVNFRRKSLHQLRDDIARLYK